MDDDGKWDCTGTMSQQTNPLCTAAGSSELTVQQFKGRIVIWTTDRPTTRRNQKKGNAVGHLDTTSFSLISSLGLDATTHIRSA
ncbi:hypothetical protein CH63R_01164 [Colletotrichum higginsianum IMI 349063]|uniref:Uncharacterized protein n=1 Tax=Colletotrichum higginsianum (strain IMI 349063) TaxID=759273 RepID=A0A1B7YVL0_COLHI|nr:hypothetical protein CH63R_01164 [Colletotrichum higginsianum IMI 349063]OBR15984.1 hypothetical protein CH63R_01164 [Colletotrichum higginsianum IMI 349063]